MKIYTGLPGRAEWRFGMNRVYNFSAGPSMLPLPVLEKAAAELVNYKDSGMSVMEMSHRSPDYEAIIRDAETAKIMTPARRGSKSFVRRYTPAAAWIAARMAETYMAP